MYSHLFLAILPALLGSLAPSLALPVQSFDTLSIDARSFDLSSDTTPLASRHVDTELLVERGYESDESDVLSRAINEDVFPRAIGPKRTAAQAKERKAGVRAQVSTNQAKKATKKIDLQAQAAELPACVIFRFLITDTNWGYSDHRYGKPRKAKYTKVTTNKGTEHITGGYRKESRDKGFRLPKQPKTPKANFAKGEHKTNAKAVQKQAEAKARLQAKKAAGVTAHATVNTRHAQTLAHGNMPNRHDEYNVPNHGMFSRSVIVWSSSECEHNRCSPRKGRPHRCLQSRDARWSRRTICMFPFYR